MRRTVVCGIVAVLVATGEARAGKPVERRLHLAEAQASSFLWIDYNRFQENYHPSYVGDDDPRTAWTEGARGNGEGQWLRLPVTPMAGATRVRLKIRNGYQKSARLFAANARVREATVVLLPANVTRKVTLADASGWQEVVVEQPAGPLEAVELRIDAAYPGTRYRDLCVSDVQVYVTATTRENPAFEKGKRTRLLAWKKARLRSAALFRSAEKARGMPLLPGYAEEKLAGLGDGKSCFDARQPADDHPSCSILRGLEALGAPADAEERRLLAEAARLVRSDLADLRPVKLTVVDRRKLPAVDGLAVISVADNVSADRVTAYEGAVGLLPMEGRAGYLFRDGLTVVGQNAGPTIDEVLEGTPRACRGDGAVFGWARRETLAPAVAGEAAGRVTLRSLVVARCQTVDSREGPAIRGDSDLLVYDDRGRLRVLTRGNSAMLFRWEERDGGPVIREAFHGYDGELTRLRPHAARASR